MIDLHPKRNLLTGYALWVFLFSVACFAVALAWLAVCDSECQDASRAEAERNFQVLEERYDPVTD